MWLLLLMPCPLIGSFIFRDLDYLYWLVVLGRVLCVGLILPSRSSRPLPWCYIGWPSVYLVRWLHYILDHSTAKAYLHNQGGTVSPFLSRLACWILSLTNRHGITLTPSIHSYPPQCGGRLSVLGLVASRVASSPSGGSCSLSLLGPSRGGPAGIFSFYSMPALLHPGNPTTSGDLGVECLQPSLDFSSKLRVSSSCSGSSSSVHVSGRTCQWSTQTFDSGGAMLDGGSLASHHSQHVGRHSLAVSHCKRSHCGCLGRPGTQRSVISAFNPLAVQQCVLHRQGFSSSVCQAVVGATWVSTSKVYQQC